MLRINNKTHSIYHYVIHMLIKADYSEKEEEEEEEEDDDDDDDDDDNNNNNNKITVHNRNIK